MHVVEVGDAEDKHKSTNHICHMYICIFILHIYTGWATKK